MKLGTFKLFEREMITFPDTGKEYLFRFHFIDTKWFGLRLHKFISGDSARHLHDHPWSFISFILWGGYTEEVLMKDRTTIIFRPALSFNTKKFYKYHSIVDVLPNTWTLVAHGPMRNNWGFKVGNSRVPHMEYLNVYGKYQGAA